MPIFFTIYNLDWGKKLSNSQRNCRIFVYGMCIYTLIYVLLKNLQISKQFGERFDIIYTAIFVLFFVDVVTMAYLFRSYFGISIFEETLGKTDGKKYDPTTHKYIDIPLQEKLEKNLQDKKILEKYEIKEKLLNEKIKKLELALESKKISQMKKEEITNNKQRLRAAVMIQRWWRRKLYKPGEGTIFKKAQKDFEKLQLVPSDKSTK